MILQSHVAQESVVFFHFSSKILDSRFILVHFVTDNESLVKFDDLTKRKMLTRRAIESSSSLNELDREIRNTGQFRSKRLKEKEKRTMRVS